MNKAVGKNNRSFARSCSTLGLTFINVVLTSHQSYALHEHGRENFDQPQRTKIIAIKPDPFNPQNKATLTCFYYKTFLVKQTDLGGKGASRLAVVPATRSNEPVPCKEKILSDEIRIDGDQGWNGYFRGAKGEYIFFDADDGVHGGMPFGIYQLQARRIVFEDVESGGFKEINLKADSLALSYRRVYGATCSLISPHAKCWPAIKNDTGLTDEAKASCNSAYRKTLTSALAAVGPDQRAQMVKEYIEDPSVLTFNVVAIIQNEKHLYALQPGIKLCYPSE